MKCEVHKIPNGRWGCLHCDESWPSRPKECQREKVDAMRKRAACASLIANIASLEAIARKHGLAISARALSNAKDACGWEADGNIEFAAKAANLEAPE